MPAYVVAARSFRGLLCCRSAALLLSDSPGRAAANHQLGCKAGGCGTDTAFSHAVAGYTEVRGPDVNWHGQQACIGAIEQYVHSRINRRTEFAKVELRTSLVSYLQPTSVGKYDLGFNPKSLDRWCQSSVAHCTAQRFCSH